MSLPKKAYFFSYASEAASDFAKELSKSQFEIIVVTSESTHDCLAAAGVAHKFKSEATVSGVLSEVQDAIETGELGAVVLVLRGSLATSSKAFAVNTQLRRIATLVNPKTPVWIVLKEGDLKSIAIESSDRQEQLDLACKALQFTAQCDARVAAAIQKGLYPTQQEKVLVIGSGGREHAIVHKLSQSPRLECIYVSGGNYGTASEGGDCECINVPALSNSEVAAFVRSKGIACVVVGPEQPLVEGLADMLAKEGIACFGPSQRASVIEASKAWSKDFMRRHGIRTAQYGTFKDFPAAKAYIEAAGHRVVVKASGIAAGKGVLIPTSTAEAVEGARSMLQDCAFGEAGSEVVIEEFLDGEEVSVLAFCDGSTAVGMPPAQDHKRALDGDKGLNTGGMGAYAPTPLISEKQYQMCMDIVQTSVTAMAAEGNPYVGVLYAGFIMSPTAGPVMLEYNCRFGDPETQVLLPLLQSDLFDVVQRCCMGTLEQQHVKWHAMSACTVVCAAPGYPEAYPKGLPITGLGAADSLAGVKVYHAGTAAGPGGAVTSGGRVLAVTGTGKSLKAAVATAYRGVKEIGFEGMHARTDIAKRGLNKPLRIGVIGSTRGTSIQALIDAIEAGSLNARIALVVSNKAASGILQRAQRHGLPHLHIGAAHKTREAYDLEVSEALDAKGVELVLMVGYMRITSPVFTTHWKGRCLNVHPSLLPEFAGGMDTDVHAAVLAAQVPLTGCTIHHVTDQVDGGPIVLQKTCEVAPNETADSLRAKVQALEGEAFVQVVQMFALGALKVVQSLSTSTANTPASDVLTYKSAGVDIDAGEALVQAIKPYCKATLRSGCDTAELGGFGGLFDLAQSGFDSKDTVLVSGTDGVGTKLKIAQAVGKHDTIGIDLVAMCVNDILVCGAEPLFFLDYYATGALNVQEAAEVVKGIAEGCRQAGAALLGGETAEMAGMYAPGEYDVAGFSVGAVRKGDMLPRADIQDGDVMIALRSSGVHSNGFSLVRKCVERSGLQWSSPCPFDTPEPLPLGEALLTPTKIYVKDVLPLVRGKLIKAMAHITGGGLTDNIPRVLPPHLRAEINASNWALPPVFKWLQGVAHLPQEEMLRTFNCGVGMMLVVEPAQVPAVMQALFDQDPFLLGTIQSRPEGSAHAVTIGQLQ